MPTWIDNFFPHRSLLQGDRRLVHLVVGRVLSSTGFSISIPFLSLYLYDTRGIPMSAIGGMFFIAAIAGAAAQLYGGEWTDRYGRKPILVAAQAGRGVIFAGMGLATLYQAEFWVFVLLTCGSAFFGRLFEPPSGAMVADITTGERRAEAFGILRIAGNLGFAIGPAAGGFLAAVSYAALFFVSSAIHVLSSGFLAARITESLPAERRRGREAGIGDDLPPAVARRPLAARFQGGIDFRSILDTLRDHRFLRHSIGCLFFFTVLGQLMSTFSVYAVEWAGISKIELGWIYSLNGGMVTLLQFPAVRALAPYRMTTALTLGSVLLAAGYAMMGFASGAAAIALCMALVTIGEIAATPAAMNLAAGFATEETRGRYMGVYGLFNSFGWSLAPVVGGALLDASHGVAWIPWTGIGLLGLIAAYLFFDLRGRLSPALDRSEDLPPSGQAAAAATGELP
ncbi:MAG TPA: MFS transporter [Candidatus Eisenbacteria bacterium]|nr:MFS transporter [Candidatus Eisenbacteria bacterium]